MNYEKLSLEELREQVNAKKNIQKEQEEKKKLIRELRGTTNNKGFNWKGLTKYIDKKKLKQMRNNNIWK